MKKWAGSYQRGRFMPWNGRLLWPKGSWMTCARATWSWRTIVQPWMRKQKIYSDRLASLPNPSSLAVMGLSDMTFEHLCASLKRKWLFYCLLMHNFRSSAIPHAEHNTIPNQASILWV